MKIPALKKYISFICILFLGFSFSAFCETYSVVKGDTLYSISRKYQITVAELRAANNLSDKDILKAGQKLIIPEADISNAAALSSSKPQPEIKNAAAAATTPAKTSSKTDSDQVYTVKKGDTLYAIAKKNNLTVAQLLSLNSLDNSSVIKVGQKLKIGAAKTENKTSGNTNSGTESTVINLNEKTPDTRTYGKTIDSDANTKWPVSKPTVTQVRGKVSGVQLSAKENEEVKCIHEGTVMYVGVYRGFGQVLFIQSKTGLIYAYTGLGSVTVKKGDYIVSGNTVGTAGFDSISGKSQITFMVFQNGQPIDPRTAPRN